MKSNTPPSDAGAAANDTAAAANDTASNGLSSAEQPPVSPFFENLEAWAVSQDYLAIAVAKKKFACRVHKPNKQRFLEFTPRTSSRH